MTEKRASEILAEPAKGEEPVPSEMSYRELVTKILKDVAYRDELHAKVFEARTAPDAASRLSAAAQVKSQFAITDDDLKALGLTRKEVERLDAEKCSNNTTFLLLDFAKMLTKDAK